MRRRGRGAGLSGLLVEREGELTTIADGLARAREGAGGVILIEAPAGKGKSRLLTIAGDMAREADMSVLGASGSELERDFPFGVAIQLFEPRWNTTDADDQARLLEGPARWAGELLNGALADVTPAADDHGYTVIHGLYWMARNLASPPDDSGLDDQPLVLLVDDVHWADAPSLRFLAYLAERIADLPILVIVTVRPGEATAGGQILPALRRAGSVLRPGSLSDSGVAAIVRSKFPHADDEFNEACARVTNGNPFLLVELLDQVMADDQPPDVTTATRLSELAPESVLNVVAARLGAMPLEFGSVAAAVAVLGDGASLHQVARLAELDIGTTTRAADALAARHIFHPGFPLTFVHPLIRSVVRASMSSLDRGQAHRRAATSLIEEGASDEVIAAHLLSAPPGSDPRAVEVLRATARKAVASGVAESAVRMLERALAEQPHAEVHPEVLAELGHAEFLAGIPHAAQRLQDAIKLTDDPSRRAQLALTQGRALHQQERYEEAAAVLGAALAELAEQDGEPGEHRRELADELDAALIAASLFVPALIEHGAELGKAMVSRTAGAPSQAQREAIAHMALQAGLRGADRDMIVEFTELARGDEAAITGSGGTAPYWPLISGALLFVDELERGLAICEAAQAVARERDSPMASATVSYCRAWLLLEQGRIVDAATDAQAAIDARPDGWQAYLPTGYGAIASCYLQRGQLEHAETALSIIDHPEVRQSTIGVAFLLDVRALLRLAQLRPAEALEDALGAGRRLHADFGDTSPGAVPWRSTAALAHLALGEPQRAAELASEELEQARRIGITRVMIRDLRVLGLAEGGQAGIELLSAAVRTGDGYSTRLAHIHALVDLGAALRRANQRAAAREPLRRALELSHRGGATAIFERAGTELAATGARPRRVMRSGLASLTPSERRVAELAASGLTTRRVAEALFITPKTVEFHLRHTYRKLEIGSRRELAEALARSGSSKGS